MNEFNISTNSKLFAQIISAKEFCSDTEISPDCDILAVKFEQTFTDFDFSRLKSINKILMFLGTGDETTDSDFLPAIINDAPHKNCIIGNITEKNYKDIIPHVKSGEHFAILKTPIDINLAKELNILASDMGLPLKKIIMNTDIGALGYGYEYGYSIIEKIIAERQKDKYLNFPIFSDASTESLKTKEATSEDFDQSWGNLADRARFIELCACSGAIAAGANIITVKYPENIKILKGLV